MKKFEYKEPEFMIVQANAEDVITTSPLETASTDWDTGASGNGGGVGFGTAGFTI